MSTPPLTDHDARLDDVLADVERNRLLVEDSRRKRAEFQSRLRRSGRAIKVDRGRSRGLLGWLTRR